MDFGDRSVSSRALREDEQTFEKPNFSGFRTQFQSVLKVRMYQNSIKTCPKLLFSPLKRLKTQKIQFLGQKSSTFASKNMFFKRLDGSVVSHHSARKSRRG